MAGNDTTANRRTADQAGTCEPVTVVRAWADPAGQPGGERRIMPGGAQHGQVRGGPLVQRDQLVDLVAGQPAAAPDEFV